ncbi:hypothetical protein FQN54_004507 [Arachnomyces sp. PD_36]|nr:hypothetical protein FQN54_004507 [Arachnomyces sp. PD_36]
MLGALELTVTPSCTDCISWSEDGELALAAGEYVHVLTPKINGEASYSGPSYGHDFDWNLGRDQWHKAKFRANVFTQHEWPAILPKPPQSFSIGEEQSTSPVVALRWSPPGLARHRRCLLAVLNANLILSIWEPLGRQNKWTRVAVINHAIKDYFGSEIKDADRRHQKRTIRSFSWSPACHISESDDNKPDPRAHEPGYGNWGCSFLAVANDDGDVVFLRVKKIQRDQTKPKCLVAEALAHFDFGTVSGQFPKMQKYSLFARSFESKRWVSDLSWGPWKYETLDGEDNRQTARSVIAAVHKSTVWLIHLETSLQERETGTQEVGEKLQLRCYEGKHAIPQTQLEGSEVTGPLLWTDMGDAKKVCLSIGALGGIITVEFPNGSYQRIGPEGFPADFESSIVVSNEPLLENTSFMAPEEEEDRALSWDPIVGMASTIARSLRIPMAPAGNGENGTQEGLKAPHWYSQIAEFRDRFDLDYDLGGNAVARIWGLAVHRGWIVASFSLHPSDMVEYITLSEERTIIIFSPAAGQLGEGDSTIAVPWAVPNIDPELSASSRRRVRQFILGLDYGKYFQNAWERKILYAVACCSIVTPDHELLAPSKSALEYLASVSGADLSEEISKCDAVSVIPGGDGSLVAIDPKSQQQLKDAGSELFESCEMCGSGIEWYSDEEALCSEGHQFG